MAGQRRRRIDERRDPRAIPTPAADGEALTRSAVCAMLDEVLLAAQDARRAVTVVVAEARGGVESLPPNLGEVVRPHVRDTDIVWPIGPRALTLVLVDADGPSSEVAVSRIRGEVTATARLGIALGRATASPGIHGGELIDLATANLMGLKN
jgi:hypothetical protein